MIKYFLNNDLNLNKLYNSYLISSSSTENTCSEILEFLSKNFYDNQDSLTHPDFVLVKKMEGNVKNISVDQIRNLQNFFGKTSIISGIKSAIIFDADQMNINASNSCLKLLEDTPKNAYIFLITKNVAGILPTIRSRCAKITDKPQLPNSGTMSELVQIDDYYIRPFLKTTKIEEHLAYLKDFATKDRDLWVEFIINAQNLFTRIIKRNIKLSDLETRLSNQLSHISPPALIEKYNNLVKLSENTITLDLELKSSYLLLTKIFT